MLQSLGILNPKALANLVMALCSYEGACSVVQLSESEVYHYQFSSVFKSIHDLAKTPEDYEKQKQTIIKFCLKHIFSAPDLAFLNNGRLVLQTDVTPAIKAHSPSLEGKQYVHVANEIIKGNKPISVGYPISSINFCASANMSVPLSRGRVPLTQTESTYASAQLLALLPELLKQSGCELVINTTDSSYTHAAYFSPLYGQEKLVCVSRFRNGTQVYAPPVPTDDTTQTEGKSIGAPTVYGKGFYLIEQTRIYKTKVAQTGQIHEKEQVTIHEHAYAEHQVVEVTTSKGRRLRIELTRWNDMKIRSKKGYSMKDKPFDIVGVKTFDANTGELVFKDEMFVCICGKQKKQVSTEQAYQYYRSRYGIEPSFRFNKQKLFLDSYQCEDAQHFDNFLLVNQLANALLYLVAQEVTFTPKKWERNKSRSLKQTGQLSMAKARRAAQSLFSTFDKTPFLPKTSNKGKGNIKKARPHFEVVKKGKKKAILQKLDTT